MRQTPRPRVPFAMLPLLLVWAGGCDLAMADYREKATAEWRRTWDLQPGGRVEISNLNGRIDVEPSTGRAVEIVARKTASAASAEAAREALGRIEILESASPSAIRIETKAPSHSGLLPRGNMQVAYTVRLPAGTDVAMRTVNGGIELSGLTGRIEAEATNGGVKAREIAGPISARTTNGGVEVDLARLAEGGVKLSCTNGGITLRLPSDAKATISARVTNGGVSATGLDLEQSAGDGRRRLEGRLNGGGAPVEIEGMNGGIRISAR